MLLMVARWVETTLPGARNPSKNGWWFRVSGERSSALRDRGGRGMHKVVE